MPAHSALPHGSRPTPVTSELVVRTAARPEDVAVGDDWSARPTGWWSGSRPGEGGRSVLVRRARTRVHEYGGAAWAVSHGVLWFAHSPDQRLDPGAAEPVAVTPEEGIRPIEVVRPTG